MCCNIAVCAYLPPEKFADLDAIKASADALNKANEIATARGVSLGYHNHWAEFQTKVDGQTAWAALIERLDPSVFVELDIYWTTLGGADPKQVIADLGDRLWLLHVKDGPCDASESPMVPAGSGTLDIPGILATCGGSCSCATCHVYVDEDWVDKLPDPALEESDMLDTAHDLKDNSRLSCQIVVSEELDGLTVTTPARQI